MIRESQKGSFHDYRHALDFDQQAASSDIRSNLGMELIEAMNLKGGEMVLDIATGTGRFAQPVSRCLKGGKVIGLDEATAMLGVAREKSRKEPIPGYFQVAGNAQEPPFHDGIFDSAFVAFSLHHFGRPMSVIRETHRILKPGGRLFVLDPVFHEAQDSVDRSLNDLINRVFRRSHGENFRFHSAGEVQKLLTQENFKIVRADLHSYFFDQDGMDGVPTGRHWLEVVQELQKGPEEFRSRFEKNYFVANEDSGQTHVKGSFNYALVCGEKG
ncbi:MAG: methyltransferase domain-containing protein [Candidatus Binatia bacterium]|nr:methyltransferase domain-containing protein [Candidatus Binatia bacterium]